MPNQLQTFRDCNEGNLMSENTHSLQRKRRSSSKNSTDTLNLGIKILEYSVHITSLDGFPFILNCNKPIFNIKFFSRNSLHIKPTNVTDWEKINF